MRKSPYRTPETLKLAAAAALVLLSVLLFFLISRYTTPYGLESILPESMVPGYYQQFHDFDHDGFSERLVAYSDIQEERFACRVDAWNEGTIDQANFSGALRPDRLLYADITGDNFDEIIAFTVVNEKLYLSIYDLLKQTHIIKQAYLMEAEQPNPHHSWDMRVIPYRVIDLEKERDRRGIIFGVASGLSKRPRGIYIFDIATKTIVQRFETDANIISLRPMDLDRNGTEEILVNSWATGNIKSPRRHGDFKCWAFFLDNQLNPVIPEKSFGEYPSGIAAIPIVRNDNREILIWNYYTGHKSIRNSAVFVDSDGRETVPQEMDLPPAGSLVQVVQSTFKGEASIFVAQGRNKDKDRPSIYKFDLNLKLLKHIDVEDESVAKLTVQDLNHDGENEIICVFRNWLVIYDDNLSELAKFPLDKKVTYYDFVSYRHNGDGLPVDIGISCSEGAYQLRLTENKWYAWSPLLAGGGSFLILLTLFFSGIFISRHSTARHFEGLLSGETSQPCVRLRPDFTVLQVNGPFIEIQGDGRTLKRGEMADERIPGWHLIKEALHELTASGEVVEKSVVYEAGNGERILQVRIHPIPDSFRILQGFFLEFTDLTDAVLAQKLQDWGVHASTNAHEIKGKVARATFALDRLVDKVRSGNLENVYRQAEKAQSIMREVIEDTRKLLWFIDLEKPEFRNADIRLVVGSVLEQLNLEGYDALSVRKEVAGDLKSVRIDTALIQQLLREVILNALEAIAYQGEILIDIAMQRAPDHHFEEYVAIEIADNGPGISAEHLPRIFEARFTTREKGNGIGLAQAKKIVEVHKGIIEADSREGEGTRIRILLPSAESLRKRKTKNAE